MVHGRKPNLSNLKIIGSLAYVLIKNKKARPGQDYNESVYGIGLSGLDGLDSSPLFFSVPYVVNGQECWDNNSEINVVVDFRRPID
ncbi:hypothetical protein V3481_018811 [Fusarium oxysporum f. sp. vasinfectum]